MSVTQHHQYRILSYIDKVTDISGRLLAWLGPLMMLMMCIVVMLRYGFDLGTIALQESITYLHGCIFMLGAAYTLKRDGHVRVDIFYRNYSPTARAWINSLGGIIFLLPMCTYIFIISWDYVLQSWQIREVSTEPGGLPGVYLLKALIPLMAINLGLQGLAEIIRDALVLISDDEAQHGNG
jgi:TRAP-type mannitol/chloroaromatic compound transport system permease small subunit